MVDHRIGRLGTTQRLARMALLSARLLARASRRLLTRAGFFSPSLDGGLPLLLLFRPSRRSNSAMRAPCATSSAMSSSFERWLSKVGSTNSLESVIRRRVNQNMGAFCPGAAKSTATLPDPPGGDLSRYIFPDKNAIAATSANDGGSIPCFTFCER